MKRLAIMLLTHASDMKSPRVKYAERTLKATLDKLTFDGEISVHIADDGSPERHRENLRKIAGGYAHVHSVGVTNAEGRGYGASYNLATQAVHPGTDYVLPLEDDWELTEPLDVTPYANALDEGANCVRLGYIGFTQKLEAVFESIAGQVYLRFRPDSPEPHVWAGHPRLETVEFQRSVGPWPEGLDAGSTEFAVARRANARVGILWPFAYRNQYAHIGTVQARSDQT